MSLKLAKMCTLHLATIWDLDSALVFFRKWVLDEKQIANWVQVGHQERSSPGNHYAGSYPVDSSRARGIEMSSRWRNSLFMTINGQRSDTSYFSEWKQTKRREVSRWMWPSASGAIILRDYWSKDGTRVCPTNLSPLGARPTRSTWTRRDVDCTIGSIITVFLRPASADGKTLPTSVKLSQLRPCFVLLALARRHRLPDTGILETLWCSKCLEVTKNTFTRTGFGQYSKTERSHVLS